MEFNHISVMLDEAIEALNIKPNGIYVDGTVGGGGHSFKIASMLNNFGKLICVDRDADALYKSKSVLAPVNNCEILFEHDNFKNLVDVLDKNDLPGVDGVLLDLGVSSYQIDEPSRGFSYMKDAPLDMRMDCSDNLSAFDIVNTYSEDEIYYIIKTYGEERWSKKIAHAIITERKTKPIATTLQLVEIISNSVPKNFNNNSHPAKKTFQALRIAVNDELNGLGQAIENIIERLNPGGRICIITFHSLEDRIVKNTFRNLEKPCTCPADFPVCICNKAPICKVITKKPICPSSIELTLNKRSHSAKLRVAEKI